MPGFVRTFYALLWFPDFSGSCVAWLVRVLTFCIPGPSHVFWLFCILCYRASRLRHRHRIVYRRFCRCIKIFSLFPYLYSYFCVLEIKNPVFLPGTGNKEILLLLAGRFRPATIIVVLVFIQGFIFYISLAWFLL